MQGVMEGELAFHNPLSFNLKKQRRLLLTKTAAHDVYHASLTNAQSIPEIFSILSTLLAIPAFTIPVAKLFRPILFDLCARFLEKQENTEEELAALCLLVEVHEELFPILYHFLKRPRFSNGPLHNVVESTDLVDESRIHRLLLAYWRILSANRQLPDQLFWSLSPLYKLASSKERSTGTRLLAIRCYAFQSGMGEAEREKWEHEAVGKDSEVDCPVDYGVNEGVQVMMDGWLLPVVEYKRVREARNAMVTEDHGYYDFEGGDEQIALETLVLSPFTANIYGAFLLKSRPTLETTPDTALISTPTAISALRTISLNFSDRFPILITSPPSSGKSLFISHLASYLFPGSKNQIVIIQLADTSLDPRSLLGNYVSSLTQPGVFEWKEGVLVRAMREGKWVVFKDIDRASNDVLGLIKPLVESLEPGKNWIGGRATIEVPGHDQVIAEDTFAIFATRSVTPSRSGTFPAPTFFGAHKFTEVIVPSPSVDELRSIVISRFPRLGDVARGLIQMWESIRAIGSTSSTRDIGLKDLEKYCTRVESMLPTSSQFMDIDLEDDTPLPSIFPHPHVREEMFLAARDIYFGSGASTSTARTRLLSISQTVGAYLGLDEERQGWLLNKWKPEESEFGFEKDVNGVVTGVRMKRAWIQAMPQNKLSGMGLNTGRPFAMHRPATILLSRIVTAVSFGEPLLLTGETGTGKTSVITHLANTLRQPLVSLNLSHQTESSDLLGGSRPVDTRIPATKLFDQWLDLFAVTFSRKKNEKLEKGLREAVQKGKWKQAVSWWKGSAQKAKEQIQNKRRESEDPSKEFDSQNPRKRRKLDASTLNDSETRWSAFEREVDEFSVLHIEGKGKFAFAFVEGPLVKALRAGDWVLLDEINLASPETLECISSILQSPTASITLTEQGSLEPVPRHPNFRLFACMNPATDVGKKDLPPNIRSRFTEIEVPPPDAHRETLLSIVEQYIGYCAVGDKKRIHCVSEFYLAVKNLSETRQIADGSNHRPHYSMRTLARALTFAADIAPTYSLRRAIWEGCMMAFTMVLDAPSAAKVVDLAKELLLPEVKNGQSMNTFLAKDPPPPQPAEEYVKFGPFYLETGELQTDPVDDYIMTPSVYTKLTDLARIILTRRFPVLIEGPTSSGKTSAVEYLAKRTGHRFVRINNHEHTDIQEYLGSYVSDPQTGKLVFTDGLLVRALRNGDWIVLDELNLAPTDVLEALNRLLDDNRELVIPETGEVIKPHKHFMLFATQNPPGLYAGRKVLSRAFRNRFLEVHFDDVPEAELQTILCERCRIAPSRAEKIVSVFRELQKRRQSGRVFESKHGFATLRDLFRWGSRQANSDQELAEDGYMLLSERARREDDKAAVKEVIETIMRVKINERAIYNLDKVDFAAYLGIPYPSSPGLVWTTAMQRLFILVTRALRFNEPVLLVGETGSGKTSVCQEFAAAVNKRLYALNCHQNTETADIIGGLRPVRNRGAVEAEILREAKSVYQELGGDPADIDAASVELVLTTITGSDTINETQRGQAQALLQKIARAKAMFEWHDGPLVEAMRQGDIFLLDEISLADDSVLERLNSVLEPSRTIVLAEKGGDETTVQADPSFKLVATMNPGGDYGKKELSPALRNRFTEIWVPAVDQREDLELIISKTWKYDALSSYTYALLDFVQWLSEMTGDSSFLNLRDILAWVNFSNEMFTHDANVRLPANEIFHHAAHMAYLDGLASVPTLSSLSQDSLQNLKAQAAERLHFLAPVDVSQLFVPTHDPRDFFQLGSFAIPRGPHTLLSQKFNFQAPTSQNNAMRVVRACQLAKPILLEGSPGVGKTSLITALAAMAGHSLCRINLSDQSDIIDLFGSDLPVEGGGAGEFAWKDGEFLKALQEGNWVLLDEMNLAPQAVLEGLNAVLDHRGTVYIPELGRSFVKHPSFRIFAAQNPLSQGGGRKGLPKSFMNRFTKVYIDQLSAADLVLVCHHYYPDMDRDLLQAMVMFNSSLNDAVTVRHTFGREGSPWEFNLRDVLRWCSLLQSSDRSHPVDYLRQVYLHRFRNMADREQALSTFNRIFGSSQVSSRNPSWTIAQDEIQIGTFRATRENYISHSPPGRILQSHLTALEAAGSCISRSWLSILTGKRHSGKTSLARLLAQLTGHKLYEISINSATDTMDLLGGFEQIDPQSRMLSIVHDTISLVCRALRSSQCQSYTLMDDVIALRREVQGKSPSPSKLVEIASRLLNNVETFEPLKAQKLQALLLERDAFAQKAGRFEWVDGPLVAAMKEGHWLLLDGANLCNPSVLDRLNSLCEEGGFLTLSERGFVDGKIPVLRPTKGFRLFMSVDPQHGELSRAMRNRGIEVALLADKSSHDHNILRDHIRLPAWKGFKTLSHFGGLRRAAYSTPDDSITHLPSGHALEQFSSLSPLLDQIPSVLSTSSQDPNPSQHVLVRLIPSGTIQSFARWVALDSLNRFQEVPEGVEVVCRNALPRVDVALARFRDEFRSLQGTSLVYSAAGPMDPYLFLPPSDVNSLQHAFILKLMEVIVTITNNKRVVKMGQNRQIKYSQKEHDRIHRTSLAVNALLSEIDATGHTVLEQSLQSSNSRREESLKDLSVARVLLQYASYLHKCVNGSTLDYSSVQTIAKWIVDAAESFSVEYLSLVACARTLQDITSLSSGLGLTEIWKSFLSQKALDPSEISRLEVLAVDPSCSNDLRRQMINLMALATLRGSNTETNSVTFIEDLEQRHLPELRTEPLFAIITLGLLAGSANSASQTLKQSLEHFLQTVCCQPRAPLRRMIPFQHLLWLHDAGKDHVAVRSHLQFRWMKEMWGSKDVHEGTEVASLFSAVSLKRVLCLYDWSHNRLSELAEYGFDLETCAQLCLINCESYLPRSQQIFALLRQTVFRIASCFTEPSEEASHNSTMEEVGDLQNPLARLESVDDFDKYPAFTAAMRTHLMPVLKKVGADHRPHGTPLLDLGVCWIAISRVVLELLIPDAPIDPVTVQMCSSDYWRQQESNYAMQLRLHNQLEMSVTGNGDSEVVGYLQRQLVEAAGKLRNQAPPDLRRNISRLHMFWAEVSQFQTQVLSLPRIDSLVALFKTNMLLAAQQEEVLQNSIGGFVQRLEAAYPDFEDIISPLQYALLHLQMGMRIVRQSFEQAKNREDLGIALAGFPYIRSSDQLLLHPEVYHNSANGITAFQHVVLSAASIALQVSSSISISQHLSHLSATYEQALRLWNIDRAKEEERKRMSQSLYRDKVFSHESVTDAELEEKEFMELFPSFESVLTPEATDDQHASTHRPVDILIHESDARTFVRIHEWLCASSHKASISDTLSTFQTIRMDLLSVVSKSDNVLTESIDLESLPLQLWLLDRRFTSLQSPTTAQNKLYNFYADANIPEARKAVEIISQMKTRLQSLIQEWPDQMVLQHIHTRCDAVLALDIHSPIAKILTAIELLLLQTDDWEIYASRDNTLKPNRAAMVELIVTWRRLELSSWRALLETQARDFEEGGVSGWWFRLYDALIRGPLNAHMGDVVDGEARLSKYIDELIPLLDTFIRASPLGQFQARMRLLQSFESFCIHAMSISDADRPTLERVRCVVHSTIGYFSLFTEALHTHLNSQRSALEAEVHDLIKLASWKDINVQALKQSAQRSHHQLYKIVRRFREVLRLPITDQLQPAMASGNEAHSASFDASALLNPSSVDADNGHVNSTYRKFAQLVRQRIRPFLVSKTGRSADSLATEIIVTSKDLAAITVSSALPAEKRERQLKSLLSRKRKALSDLLKELKRAGLSSSVKPEVLNRNASPHWIREQPVITEDSQVIERSESYLYRLNGLFPDLRASLSNHHADLGTKELHRGILFLESAFALAIGSRHRLAEISLRANQIDKIIRRLRMFQESQSIVSHGPSVFGRLVEVNNVLTKAQTALQEIRNEMDTYSRRNPTAPTTQQIIEDCDALMAKSSSLQSNMSTIIESLSLTAHPVLLEDEYNAVLEALGQINEIVLSLNRWIEIDPRLTYLFAPAAQWLSGFDLQTDFVSRPSVSPSDGIDGIDGIVNACLVCIQGLLAKCPEIAKSAEEDQEDDDAYIKQECKDIQEVAELLRADQMLSLLNRLVLTLTTRGSDYHADLRRVLPFLDLYAKLVQTHVITHSHFIAAFFKLNYVLCSVLLTLSKQGFCKPPEENQDDGGSGEGTAEMTDGVGMGEGTGNQNVSKEIEEESQVEGLKGDKLEEERGPEKNQEDNDAIEMDQDFDGEMEGVPDEGDEQDGEKSDDEESKMDPEEQIGDLDISDPAAVDEKLWGDEKGPQDSDKDDQKTNQDHSKSKNGDSDVVAKEGGEKHPKQKEKSGESEEQEQPIEDEVMNEEQDSEEPGVSGAPMDEHIPEADTLDLPDDMDMNAGEQLPDEVDMDGEELDDMEENADQPQDVSPDADNETLNRQEDAGKDAQDEDIGPDGLEPPAAAEAKSTDAEQENEQEQENTGVAQPDISTGDGAPISEDDPNPDTGANNQGGEKGASSGVVGEDSSMVDAEDNKNESDPLRLANQPQFGQQTEPSQGPGHAQSGVQQGPQGTQSSSQLEHNPLRSLGDALKEVQQRFNDILNGEEREDPQEQLGNSDAPQIEYLRPEDDDHDMQALGPSGKEQASRLKDLRFLEDQKEEQPAISTDVDMDMGEIDANPEESRSHERSEVEKTSTAHQEDVEGAILYDSHSTSSQQPPPQANNPDAPKVDIETEDDSDLAGPVVEAELRAWHADGLPDNRAEHIWRLYESLTHDLAYALCEQLRLILEPTLTTRLKGDYRTGKRLNMKKIIPYIASDYTKDKIWLRRTRPSQREYQVLIALDDSRSMAESHSVHLAYQTLALVSKALSRLEAGDIGIARFGEAVELLHGFEGAPFTDQAGVEVIRAFHFNQKATNVLSLVETSLRVLELARERKAMSSSTAADLWQLEIIISDGMCQDHEKLRPVLRKAEEQKVMIVFIIIDSLHSTASVQQPGGAAHGSILSMTKAEIVNVNGKMDMQIQRYLDSFPFEYYVVLRNVEALPEVLSATLKQFFERISEE
ncbi:midasin nuclear aaa atpase [Moniliophthora roreri]|nr:midasin nuclear aaa atpase [Moniliophthora roreri]